MSTDSKVTLCIAAACTDKGKERIVFCSDRKITQGDTSSETGDKVSWLIPRWPAVYAGTIARAQELIDLYRKALKGTSLKSSTIFNVFKRVPLQFKANLQDERAQQLVGMRYKKFLKRRQSFPRYDQLLARITDPDIECELILTGFLNGDPYMFVVSGDASVSYEDDFAAIGSGADLATAVLRYRAQHSNRSLGRTLYHLYEAKKFAEMEPHVGKKTFLDVVIPRGKEKNSKVDIRSLSKEGFEELEGYRDQFGYQSVRKIEIKDKYLVAF